MMLRATALSILRDPLAHTPQQRRLCTFASSSSSSQPRLGRRRLILSSSSISSSSSGSSSSSSDGIPSSSTATTSTTQPTNSSSSSGSTNTPTSSSKFKTKAEFEAYMKQTMEILRAYEDTRQLYKLGKLQKRRHSRLTVPVVQVSAVAFLVVAFITTPLLARKIYTDEEFRKKWIPEWYDFSIKYPESVLLQQQQQDERYSMQKELYERAIRGEFSEEKLTELEKELSVSSSREL